MNGVINSSVQVCPSSDVIKDNEMSQYQMLSQNMFLW